VDTTSSPEQHDDELQGDKKVRCWRGTQQGLLVLAQTIEKQFEPVVTQERGNRSLLFLGLRRKRVEVRTPVPVLLTLTNEVKRTNRGAYQQLLNGSPDEIEWDRIREITFRAVGDDGRITVTLKASGTPTGAHLEVVGKTQWAPAATQLVGDALLRGRPWWHVLRHPLVYWLYSVAVYVFVVFWAIRSADLFATSISPWIWIPASIAGLIFLILLPVGILRVFPAFELLAPEAQDRRQFVKRIIVSLAAGATTLLGIATGVAGLAGKV
jgi:hypothetical protein